MGSLMGSLTVLPNDRIAALLDGHTPADDGEAASMALVRRLLAEIGQQGGGSLMSKHYALGHVTGSALVLDADSGRFLLHYHKKLARWLQFGGHAEDDEADPLHTALREAREESGLADLCPLSPAPADIDAHLIPARGGQPAHYHLDFRYVLITNMPAGVGAGADESAAFLWLAEADLDERGITLDPALHRLIGKAAHLYAAHQERRARP
jgi:8-oxo-dGTP pyrophosphatase MutT (NUDIX family)